MKPSPDPAPRISAWSRRALGLAALAGLLAGCGQKGPLYLPARPAAATPAPAAKPPPAVPVPAPSPAPRTPANP